MATIEPPPAGAAEHEVFNCAFATCRLRVDVDRVAHGTMLRAANLHVKHAVHIGRPMAAGRFDRRVCVNVSDKGRGRRIGCRTANEEMG
jgi:hypothetical protein